MRRERHESDDEDDDVPLHHKRPFGAGLKRQKVEFVRATDPDADSTVSKPKAESSTGASVADLYASIVFKKDTGTSSSSGGEEDQGKETEKEPSPPICAICSLPITATMQQHEASLAHQVSLTHSHPPSSLDRSRMGLRALESQGWDPDSRLGLGRDGEGMRFPIKTALKEDNLGIGAKVPERQTERQMPKERPKDIQQTKKKPLTAKERKALQEKERRKAERLQAEIYGRIDVERYLRGS